MDVLASILVPTRRRAAYLDVALASVAPQAAARGADVVVVEDGPRDEAAAAAAERHGARYVALGDERGINAARNAAVAAAGGELLCFLDDDVEVWDGWLDALVGAAEADPERDAFGGPIRPRLEDARLRLCGREPPPVTSLDLGAEDTDATFVWGANMALRRSAVERIGAFDERLGGAGDEEDWQRRLRAAGGAIRYVAAAGVDHRRTGPDARTRALSRAAYHRGRAARRWDERKGAPPRLAHELRVLAGCVWHGPRRRCANGIVLSAMAAGRLREALARGRDAPAGDGATAGGDGAGAGGDQAAWSPGGAVAGGDQAAWSSGVSGTLGRRALAGAAARDAVARVAALPRRVALMRAARAAPVRRVLAIGVARPEHRRRVARMERELRRSRHEVDVVMVPGAPGAGKWANLNAVLAAHPPAGADWLLVVDDDVVLPRGFLDAFLFLAERFDLKLAQPAHAHASHAAWAVTRRRPRAVARQTRFVEIGPVTAIHREAFGALLPFPDLAMGWGLDAHWGAVAAQRGWAVGVVDATPVRHRRPVATDYPRDAAVAEAEAFLDGRAYLTRAEAGETLAAHARW